MKIFMRIGRHPVSILLLVLLVAGCSTARQNPQGDSLVMRAIDSAEEGRRNQDAAKLRAAAMLLRASGAYPAEDGSQNLADVWQQEADNISAQSGTQTDIPTRGRIVGPAYRNGSLVSAGKTIFRETFYATRAAEVSLRLGQSSAFDIKIMADEADGKTVCHHKNIKKFVTCKWFPAWTGPYRIEIKNTSGQEEHYYLITN